MGLYFRYALYLILIITSVNLFFSNCSSYQQQSNNNQDIASKNNSVPNKRRLTPGSPNSSSLDLRPTEIAVTTVDFRQKAFYPGLKSKIGFARSVSEVNLPRGIQEFDQTSQINPYISTGYMRPGIFCTEIDFDHNAKNDSPSICSHKNANGELKGGEPNYALDQNKPCVADSEDHLNWLKQDTQGRPTQVYASPWFQELRTLLYDRKIKALHQLIGAPLPFQMDNIERPAIHPPPTQLANSALTMKLFVQANQKNSNGKNVPTYWSIWNEPGHSLLGDNKLNEAAQTIVDIYQKYFFYLNPFRFDQLDSIGMASFIYKDSVTSFLNKVFKNFRKAQNDNSENSNLELDFISLNSYFGNSEALTQEVRTKLGNRFNESPLVFTQYSPVNKSGDLISALNYLTDLENFNKQTDVEHVCISYWVGGGKKSIISPNQNSSGQFIYHFPYHIIKFYMMVPTLRSPVKDLPDGIHGIAGSNYQKVALLLWSEKSGSQNVEIKLDGISQSILGSQPKFKVYHIDENYHSMKDLAPFQKGIYESNSKMKLALNGPAAILLVIENGDENTVDPLLREGLGKNIRAEKTFSYNKRSDSGELSESFGYYDQVRNMTYLGVKNENDQAIAGALFEKLPDDLFLNFKAYNINDSHFTNQQALMGVRIEFLDKSPSSNVMIYFPQSSTREIRQIPKWSRSNISNDKMILNSSIGTGTMINLKPYLQENWNSKKILISFWMINTGVNSLAEIYLSDRSTESQTISNMIE